MDVRELEQVIPSSRRVQELGFETEVREAQLLSLARTRRMLYNLMLLIGFTTYFAILLSEGGVMFEAVLRKRRQIGVMRILGVPPGNVVSLFLLEAVVVALVGWLCANVVFALFAPLADTTVVHAWLGLPETGSLFSLRWSIKLAVGGVLCLLGLFSGYLPAKYAGRIEPGIVLSEREMRS
ncbi:MAG: ABC transporter permease [Candidatus Oleimicrobiaceae bacterium]